MNLSINDIAIPLHPNLGSQSRELREGQQVGTHQSLQRSYRPSPRSSQALPFPVCGHGHRALLQQQDDDSTEPLPGPPIDPLSVLVYAGRLIDRESQISP